MVEYCQYLERLTKDSEVLCKCRYKVVRGIEEPVCIAALFVWEEDPYVEELAELCPLFTLDSKLAGYMLEMIKRLL